MTSTAPEEQTESKRESNAMPTSTYVHIPTMVAYLQMVRPTSLLDVGLGNGKIGFLARDLLDVMLGQRYRKEDWKVRIDGIEIFEDYIQEHQRAIYDNIYIGDAIELMDKLGIYDLVLLCDVVEHFKEVEARELIHKCFDHCRSHVIVSIPLGENWTQSAIYGNPHEEHHSFWSLHEFEPVAECKAYFTFPQIGDYGCFLIKKEDYLYHRWEIAADRLFAEGKQEEALQGLKGSLADFGPSVKGEYLLVDLLLKTRRIEEAIDRLRTIQTDFPDDRLAKQYIETLQLV
jgi:hypothetical protein